MVHVVYLGAVSNGGSWWRMHKALQQEAQGSETEALVINSLRDGGEQVYSKHTVKVVTPLL